MMKTDEPQPISMEDSLRLWNLKKLKAPLSERDVRLLEQAFEWQMWVSHGIRLQNGRSESKASSRPSKSLQKAAAVL